MGEAFDFDGNSPEKYICKIAIRLANKSIFIKRSNYDFDTWLAEVGGVSAIIYATF